MKKLYMTYDDLKLNKSEISQKPKAKSFVICGDPGAKLGHLGSNGGNGMVPYDAFSSSSERKWLSILVQ